MLIEAKRAVGLLALAVLLLASVALGGTDAEAKKKEINVVQCAVNQLECLGTNGKDQLVGTDSDDSLRSLGGNDVLRGNGDDDVLQGGSGDDTYAGYLGDFGSDLVFDIGGGSDLLDLSSFSSEDFAIFLDEDPTDLILDGPASNDIEIDGQFSGRRIEKIKFSDKTLKGKQIDSLAAPEESLDESSAQEEE